MANFDVGSGQTYSTPEAALAAIPTTRTEDHAIRLHDVTEYLYTADGVNHLDFTGFTGSFYIRMYPMTGISLRENLGRDNPLRYNAGVGVGLRTTGTYGRLININCSYVEIIDVQLKVDATTTIPLDAENAGNSTPLLLDRLLVDSNQTATNIRLVQIYGPNAIMQRCLIYARNTGGNGLRVGNGALARFCAVVRNSEHSAALTAFSSFYGGRLQNCVEAGFATAAAASGGGWNASCWNNASMLSSGLPGSNNEHSISDPFTDRDKDSLDLRTLFTASIVGEGLTDAGIAEDFSGFTLPNPPTIGAWEPSAPTSSGQPMGQRRAKNIPGMGYSRAFAGVH